MNPEDLEKKLANGPPKLCTSDIVKQKIERQADVWHKAIKDNPRASCYICGGFRIQLFKIKRNKKKLYVCKNHKHLTDTLKEDV